MWADANEFIFPYEIVSMRRVGSDFTYRYLGALIDIKVLGTGSRRIVAVRIHRAFPEKIVIRKNYALLSRITGVFPISPWRRKGARSKVELVVTNKDVCRQLSRIPEFELILINKESLVAGRFVSEGTISAEYLSFSASVLYNLHVYAQRVMQQHDFPLDPVSVNALCPFCREQATEIDGTTCEMCGTLHHTSCWKENRGCAVFGCQRREQEGLVSAK